MTLEERLKPKGVKATPYQDWLVVGVLIGLVIALLPVWRLMGVQDSDVVGPVEEFARQTVSFALLPAMGMLLCIRCGALDLSVWVVSALGGMVALKLGQAGLNPGATLAGCVFVGACVGAINGALVAGCRLPSIVITPLLAAAIMWGLSAQSEMRWIPLPQEVASRWFEQSSLTPRAFASVIVLVGYVGTMVFLTRTYSRKRFVELSHRWRLFWALCASGALSAASGMFWLVTNQATPIPNRLIDDVQIPTAVILAGGAFLAGHGRILLAGVLLPVAVAISSAWSVESLSSSVLGIPGYALCVFVGGIMIVISRWLWLVLIRKGMRKTATLAAGSLIGPVLLSASAWAWQARLQQEQLWMGAVILWGAMILAVAVAALCCRSSQPDSQAIETTMAE